MAESFTPQNQSLESSGGNHLALKGKEVLVTGATGFTGKVLVKRLLALGANVRAIARQSSDLSPFADDQIRWFRGDVYDPDTVAKACTGVEYIFHVAAAFRQAKITDEEYSKVHVESTKLLARAVCGSEKFKRFVHVSTMGVHGHIENPPGDENSPYAPGDQYQRTKLEAEQWLREYAGQDGLPYTVIRPTGIYGPGDRRLLKVFKMATWPVFPILGNGKCYYHLVHVEDLVEAIVLAAHHEAALFDVFLAGDREPVQLEEMARIVAHEARRKIRVLRIPVTPFFIAADICEAVCKPLGIEPPLYRRRVAFYTKDRWFDTSKIHQKLGFCCAYSNEHGIRSTTRWYQKQGWIKSFSVGHTTNSEEKTCQ